MTGRRTGPSPDDEDLMKEIGEALGFDPHRSPSPERVQAIRAAAKRLRAEAEPSAQDTVGGRRDGTTRRSLLYGGVAAGFGVFTGYAVRGATSENTPGATVEALAVRVAEPETTATAGLINHTWGTELLLDVTGLTPGATYDVVYRTRDGGTNPAGSLLAVADVLMSCRFNAAPLRAEVQAIEVLTGEGAVAISADVPPVTA